ncbi:unnamed protein product, partial [Porites evermanni]
LQVLRLIFQVLLASVGVAGNAIVCLVITFQPQMHTTINYFIRNLAIADLGILILSFPLAVIMEQVPSHWPLGEFFCRYIFPLSDIFFGVSVWSIRDEPLYFVMNFTDHRPVVNIVECSPKWPNKEEEDEMRQIYIIGLTIFWYVLPLAIVTVTFGSITRKLRTSTRFNKSIRDDGGRDTEKRARKRLRERQNSKAKKLLTPVVLVFAVTMLPLNVFRLVFLYWKEFTLHKYFWVYYNVCVICVITNSSANFFIYSVVSEEFRQSFKSFIC